MLSMPPNPNSLIFMGAFGIGNILSGLTYLLLLKKAKHLAPHILAIIPTSYALGSIGLKLQDVHANAEFNGQYMMYVYLGLCAVISAYYFISAKKEAQ